MSSDHRQEWIDTFVRLIRPRLFFAPGISLVPHITYRIVKLILQRESLPVDIAVLGVFVLSMVLVAWLARSWSGYFVAVATSTIVHVLLFLQIDIQRARNLEHDEFNILDNTLAFVGFQFGALLVLTAILSLPVFLIRRKKA